MKDIFFYSSIFFTLMVFIHLILSYLTGSKFFMLKAIIFFIVSAILSGFFLIYKFNLIEIFFFLLFLGILWNSYLIFFINLQNSISFRIMNEIQNQSEDSITRIELDEIFPDKIILEDRLVDMKNNGFIYEENHQIILQPKGQFYSKIINRFRKLFGIEYFG